MTIYYSPSTKGFYDTDVGYTSYPSDIIEITREQHTTLLEEINNNNKEIVVDENNQISLRDRVVIPTWQIIRLRRNRLLRQSDFTQMPDWPGDKNSWASYRQILRDIPQTYETPEEVIWPTKPGE